MYRGVQWAIVHGLQCWWVVKNGTQLSEHVCMHMHTHTHTHTHTQINLKESGTGSQDCEDWQV